eukprot:2033710-Alexandrium_andersonii.AAC.1
MRGVPPLHRRCCHWRLLQAAAAFATRCCFRPALTIAAAPVACSEISCSCPWSGSCCRPASQSWRTRCTAATDPPSL